MPVYSGMPYEQGHRCDGVEWQDRPRSMSGKRTGDIAMVSSESSGKSLESKISELSHLFRCWFRYRKKRPIRLFD